MTEIKNSTVATGGSTIKNINSITLMTEKKKSFFWGFFSGVAASLTASGIVYFVKANWPNLISFFNFSTT
ncbi:hypothetical protein [Desulfobacula phenolica]|uniref:Uncharacterized protein n=1 Tax=Desulfobacula phenolica TaxID=90732 RepID=A0A1H2I2X3_9BACT|nr:hypothetical protein [Desulfobacula phenolica]SDU38492.1 hypothetical protein SAMN04487931_107204 [Desulfobacula phenolica]